MLAWRLEPPEADPGAREWRQGNDNPVAEAHAKARRREATPPFSRSSRLRVRPALAQTSGAPGLRGKFCTPLTRNQTRP
jgi:hypothetical protein